MSGIDYDALRSALIALSYFGLPGAFPKNALLPELASDATDEQRLALLRAQQSLIEQALLTVDQGRSRHSRAVVVENLQWLDPGRNQSLDRGQESRDLSGRRELWFWEILSAPFRRFNSRTCPSWKRPMIFQMMSPPDESLLRFTQSRLKSAASNSAIDDWRDLAVEEWLAGVAAVRERVRFDRCCEYLSGSVCR